jgi:hypothetical protein
MAQGKRDRLSTEQRIDMWRRWKAGESLHEIGRAFGKGHGSIRFLLTQRGGIVPAARWRSLRTLTLAEREGLPRLKTAPFPVIGRAICSQAPGTVTSQRWWNDIRVLPSWSKCLAKIQQRSLPR